MNTQPIESQPTAAAKPKRFWLLLVGVLLIGTYAAMFIPAFTGQPINPQLGYGSLLWNGVFFWLWWKQRQRKGWVGALLGVFIGLLAFVLAAFIGGMVRHT